MMSAPSFLENRLISSGAELPILPSTWRVARLRHEFTFNKGLTITKENLQDEGIPCVNYGEVHSKYGFEVDPERHSLKCVDVSYLKNNQSCLLRRGDFVFADTSEDIDGSGNFTCFNSDQQGFAGYHTVIVRPRPRMNSRFMAYLFDSISFRKQVQTEVTGIKVFSISQAILKQTMVWLPPDHEQNAIAAFLDEKCAKVDEAVRIKEAQIALLRERRQILIQQAVTRGLNPNAPMKDSGIDWIGQIPAHWDVVPIMAVGDVIDPNPSHRNPEYVDEGFPFISTQEFRPDGAIEIDTPRRVSAKTVEEQEARCRFQIGSLVFSRKGTIGAVRILPSGVRLGILDSLCVINPKKPVDPEFLFWSLSSDYLAAQYGPTLRGAALPQLSVGRVRSLKVILPPKSEQPSLVEHIAREAGKVDSAIRLKEDQITALKEYRTTLINAAVTGKIKVA